MKLCTYLLLTLSFYSLIFDVTAQTTRQGGKVKPSGKTPSLPKKQFPSPTLEEAPQQYEMAGQLLLSGYQHIKNNRLDQALNDCRKSAEIYYALKQPLAVNAFVCVADVYFRKKDYPQALTLAEFSANVIEELAKIEAQIKDERYSAQMNVLKVSEKYRSLLIAGQCLNYLGENEKAIVRLLEAMGLANHLDNSESLADVLMALGKVQVSLKKYDEALKSYDEAMRQYKLCKTSSCDPEQRQKNYLKKQAYVIDQVGIVHAEQGNFKEALARFKEALSLMTDLGDFEGIPYAEANIASVYTAMRNLKDARSYYDKALQGFGKNSLQQAITHNNLANVSYLEGKLDEAEAKARMGTKFAEEIGAKEHIAIAQNTLGNIYLAKAKMGKAGRRLAHMMARRAYLKSLQNGGEIIVTVNLSSLEFDEGNYAKAIEMAQKGSKGALGDAKPDLYTRSKQIEGLALRKLGRWEEAAESLREAVRSSESERGMAAGDWKNLYLFFESKSNPHRELIDVLVEIYQQNKSKEMLKEAFRYAEQSKARVVLDMLQNNSGVTAQGKTSVNWQAIANQPSDIFLPNNSTIVLEFVSLPERTLLFVLTQNGGEARLEVFPIAVNEKNWSTHLRDFYASLDLFSKSKGGTKPSPIHDPLKAMYNKLFSDPDLKNRLAGKKHLVIVPDGLLWFIPFQALEISDDEYLIDKYAISYALSLTSLREQMLRRSKRIAGAKTLLAIADPELYGAGEQLREAGLAAENLVDIYGIGAQVKILSGSKANKKDVIKDLGKYRILHFAAHGQAKPEDPMMSGLVLEASELLTAQEILGLDLVADVVVMASCDAAFGKSFLGEGMISLAWAFQAAGCKSTVATQWVAFDDVLGKLTPSLHKNLKQTMETKTISRAEALRMAIRQIKAEPGFSYPGYWAPYILIGDGY